MAPHRSSSGVMLGVIDSSPDSNSFHLGYATVLGRLTWRSPARVRVQQQVRELFLEAPETAEVHR